MSRLVRRLVSRASRSVGFEVPLLSGHEEIPQIVDRLTDLKSQIDRSLGELRQTARDIGERLRPLQDEVARARKLRVLGETVGGVVHNVNNSLAAILAHTEVLLRDAPDATTRSRLDLIQQVVLETTAMVRRLGGGPGQEPLVAPGPVALRPLVTEALELTAPRWRDEAEREGASVAVTVAVDEVLAVDGDAVQLRDVLVRLILDAVGDMPRGGTIAIRAVGETPGWVSVEVSDSGTGPRDAAAVMAVVERQGGAVRFARETGSGTTVRLRLPASREPVVPPAEVPRPRSPEETRTILLVDDDARLLRTLTDLLEGRGHTVVGAGSGAEALARFDPAVIDVVITDLGMPGMTGWEVASEVKARDPRVPVFLLTGWGQAVGTDERSRFVDRIIAKPVSADVMLASIAGAARPDVRSERVAEA